MTAIILEPGMRDPKLDDQVTVRIKVHEKKIGITLCSKSHSETTFMSPDQALQIIKELKNAWKQTNVNIIEDF